MAFLTQSPAQYGPTPILGQPTNDPQNNTIPVRIQPNSSATNITVGSALIAYGTTDNGEVLVDIQTGPTVGPVVGVVPYNPQKNTYLAGDRLNMFGPGNVLYLESAAAVTSWTNLTTTAGTGSANPTVATDATSGHFTTGVALQGAAAANGLIKVRIDPKSL